MSTILGNIFTILGVIIGFVWIGIGMEIGKEAYNILLKESVTKILIKFKEARARKIAQRIIRPDIKYEEVKKENDNS